MGPRIWFDGPDQAATPAPWIVVTGLDGSGKSTLVRALSAALAARAFRLPYHGFVKPMVERSGGGSPFGDIHTDRLIYAADARLTDPLIRQWRRQGESLVSQRGWMDNFIFGAAQGVGYEETDALLRTAELDRPTAAIYLVADPDVAYERIRLDPNRDKFETPCFMRDQQQQTVRFYKRAIAGGPPLQAFAGVPSVLIDTTSLSHQDVFDVSQAFLRQHSNRRVTTP